MAEKLISVENLSIVFDRRAVLDRVSFDIEQGEILAIIGPNGAGKTLLIKSLLGLNSNYTGKITWHARVETGYVPQKMVFEKGFPMTVKEFFLLEMNGPGSFWLPEAKTIKEIETRLKEVGIAHLLNSRLGNLSQGEAQRMFIARSLLENPQIIFFDEPAAGVDAGSEETVYNLLYNIHRKNNMTMVLVSHELNVVYRFATQVICLNGKMICQGRPTEILTPENLHQLYGHQTPFHRHEKDSHQNEQDHQDIIIPEHDHS